MVSAGCAAGLKHVTAACVTGGNPETLVRIPDLTGFDKTEVVSPRYSRNVYDAAVRNIGVTMITVDTIEELERALGPRTAMIYLLAGDETTLRADVAREHREDRAPEEHPHPDRCRGRGLDDAQRAPPGGRGHRRLQWRQGTARTAVRRAAARSQGPAASRRGRPARRTTVRAATTRSGAKRRSACWPPSRPG